MKNIHILPTDKLSKVYSIRSIGELDWSEGYLPKLDNSDNLNIYITSDEVISSGEWCIDKGNIVHKFVKFMNYNHYKKIILTTDQDLIKDGVQAINNEFLEWFVKNPCEKVEVKKTDFEALFLKPSGKYSNYYVGKEESIIGLPQLEEKIHYKIIIPKEEPTFTNMKSTKPTLNEAENGNKSKPLLANRCDFVPYGEVENRCKKCGYITWVDKNKTFDEIVEDMHKSGYPKPDCYNVC